MIAIRAIRPDDLEAVAELEARAFPSPWRRAYFEGELAAPGRFCLAAVDDQGELQGYVFAMYYLDEMHINKIATHERSRRSGIASRLMAACREFGIAHGVKTISLEVRQSNEPAQAFYRRLNFHPVYVRRNYYPDGEAAVVMMAGIS